MIFDPTTCCACAAVQELQGEAPLTLSGEGLWAGVLSSGQCVLECPGSQSAAGSSEGTRSQNQCPEERAIL